MPLYRIAPGEEVRRKAELLACRGLHGHAGDHRAVDAQIVKITGAQRAQLAVGLVEDLATAQCFLDPGHHAFALLGDADTH